MLLLEKGGLASAAMVHRYNTAIFYNGVGGGEGSFSMCTFWLVDALSRVGAYDRKYVDEAVTLFESTLGFGMICRCLAKRLVGVGSSRAIGRRLLAHLALVSAPFHLYRGAKPSYVAV